MLLWGIFFDVSSHRIDINQPVHISQLKRLVSVINDLSCMKLITSSEQIGLTWPGTTKRARSILQQPKTQQNRNYCASIEKSTANAWLFLHIFNTRGIVNRVAS